MLYKVSLSSCQTYEAEADKLLANLPQWTSVQLIKNEIIRRFKRGDKDDLDVRLNKLKEFERQWERERIGYTKRLDALRSQFDRKTEQAVQALSVVQTMTDEIERFEQDENQIRPQMPGVFTVGAFKTQDTSLTLTVELRPFFANLLDTMQNWA